MCTRIVRGLPLAAAVFVMGGVAVEAQEAQQIQASEEVILEEVVVTAPDAEKPAGGGSAGQTPARKKQIKEQVSLEGAVVTTSKVEGSAIDALAGASAIGKDIIDEQYQSDSAADFLKDMPGVGVQQNNRDTGIAVNIRGLQDFGRVNVLIEGARQNFQRSGHSANGVFYIDSEMIKEVEVTRGPTSTIYGSGAIGGVVAFELLDADDILEAGEYAAVRTKGRYATNGDGRFGSGTVAARAGNFDVIGQINGNWLDPYDDGNGTEVPDSWQKTRSQFIKGRWRPAAGHQITASIINYESEFVDRTEASTSSPLIQRESDLQNRQYTLGYTFAKPDTPLIDFSAKIYRTTTDLDQIRYSNDTTRYFDITTDGIDVHNTSRFKFESVKLALTYGGDAFRDEVDTLDLTSNGDEFTPSGKRNVEGTFIQSHLTFFDMVDLIGALRYDQFELSGDGLSSEGSRVSPKVTLGVTPIVGATVFATYAEGYRAPALSETLPSGVHPGFPFIILPNTDLRPEVAHNIEAGLNLKYNSVATLGDAFRAKFVAFRNNVDDYIGPDDQTNPGCFAPPFPSCGTYQYVNFGRVKLEGFELEAVYDAKAWFAGLNVTHVRGTDEETGEPVLSVRPDQIVATIGMRALHDKLVFGGRGRLVDAQDRIPSGSLVTESDGYAIFDLFGQYQLNQATTLNLNIDNVFDHTYREYLYIDNAPGFNARIGMTMRLGAQ
jgi:hemoglobin/transferrin/lactoferrin receptor protein